MAIRKCKNCDHNVPEQRESQEKKGIREGKILFFRPEWVCGRYNETGKVAICYNLIEGMSYLFEEYSALVISVLLELPRNGHISLEELSKRTDISTESLVPFFEELKRLGLVTDYVLSEDELLSYRLRMSQQRCAQAQTAVRTTAEKLPMFVSTTEMDYADKAGGITNVMLELTYNCSEKCIHCYNIGATRNDTEVSRRGELKELSLNDYKRIIDDLYEKGLVKVCLSGGDPFSKSFVWDIIEYIYKKGIVFDIFTNGQRIVKDVKRLAKYHPRLVGVSIYSGNSDTHDKITRVQGSWKRSMAVVEELTRLSVPLVLKCCVMQPNVKDYYTVSDLGKHYGAVVQYELNITDAIDADKCASKYLRLTPELLELVLRDDNTPMYVGKEAPNYGGQPKKMNENACGSGVNSFCITPDGDLIPCCAFHMKFGNLKEESLSKILNNSETLRYWQGLTLSQYEECGKHEYCDYCNLCPGNNYIEHSSPIKAGENNCYMAKSRWELANRMKNGYDPLQGKSLQEKLSEIYSQMDYSKLKRED